MKKRIKEYIVNPYQCPVCGSDLIKGHGAYPPDGGCTSMTQTVECESCGSNWDEIYTLTAVENIVKGEKDE